MNTVSFQKLTHHSKTNQKELERMEPVNEPGVLEDARGAVFVVFR